MMKYTKIAVAAALALTSTMTLAAGDAAAGKAKYAMCQGCHGPNGESTNPKLYPALKGKDAAYVKEQLNAFRSGKRDNATMKAMAVGLTDADVENLAAYIATLK